MLRLMGSLQAIRSATMRVSARIPTPSRRRSPLRLFKASSIESLMLPAVVAGSLSAGSLSAGSLSAVSLSAGSLSAGSLSAGSLSARSLLWVGSTPPSPPMLDGASATHSPWKGGLDPGGLRNSQCSNPRGQKNLWFTSSKQTNPAQRGTSGVRRVAGPFEGPVGGQGDCALADVPDVAIIAPITTATVSTCSIRLIGLPHHWLRLAHWCPSMKGRVPRLYKHDIFVPTVTMTSCSALVKYLRQIPLYEGVW